MRERIRLDGPGQARRTDPTTSWQAAYKGVSGKNSKRKLVFLEHVRHPRGLTDFELGDLLARMGQRHAMDTARKRRCDLRDLGLVEDSRKRRLSPSGSQAIVWWITPLALEISDEMGETHAD